MLKKILLFINTQLIVLCLFGQQQTINSDLYNELKLKGKLDNNINYSFPALGVNGFLQKIKPTFHQTDSVGTNSCGCIVPLDSTFNVAEFIGYSPIDGYRNDDASTGPKVLPFSFNFYGITMDTVFINNNGNISFTSPYSTFSSTGFPNTTFNMIAPFWADVDTRDSASGLVYYKITDHYMIVKWDSVGYFSNQVDKKNTFQLIISDGTDPIIPNNNNVAFCYGDMQWTTGNASQGVNGFGGVASTTGVNVANGINYAQICRSDSSGYLYDGPYGLNDGVDFLDNQSYFFDVSNPLNIPATAYDSICDTMFVVSNFISWNVFINAMEVNEQAYMSVVSAPLGMTFTIDTMPSSLRVGINYTPEQTGDYQLKIAYWDSYNTNNVKFYEKSLNVQSVFQVGINALKNENSFANLFPNPSSDILNIELSDKLKIEQLIVRNINGQVILINNGTNIFSTKDLKEGIYFIEIKDSKNKKYFQKFIKN